MHVLGVKRNASKANQGSIPLRRWTIFSNEDQYGNSEEKGENETSPSVIIETESEYHLPAGTHVQKNSTLDWLK